MKNFRIKKIVHRSTHDDGLGRRFSVVVPIVAHEYWIDGEWLEAISASEWQKVERAIETTYPGWFHTHYKTKDKASCRACHRDEKVKKKAAHC